MPAIESESGVRILDLQFGAPGTIAAFLVESNDGPVLVETGPDSTFAALERGLNDAGHEVGDVRHVLVTHIHLDHAGAAWQFGARGATVAVHPLGAPHLADPSKLLASARRIYGERMDSLWGRLEPIPRERLRAVADREIVAIGDLRFEALHTPGHAGHHIAWRIDSSVFTGDVGGVRMTVPVVPPCPPPDIDLEAWRESIRTLRSARPSMLLPTHFGAFSDAESHLDALEDALDLFSAWVRDRVTAGMDEASMVPALEAFTAALLTERGCDASTRERYAIANPAFMSVAGLIRYWRKRGATASASAPL
jgi:glyoxylase-like metal-dependent hydrolase (beta-lactamase superfamily II)